MIRRWLVLAAVTLVAPAAFADRAVTGSVVDDATGLPVVGALVSVGSAEATTDDQGQFRIAGVAFGRVDVVVIADGYRAYFGAARIGAVLTIRLEAAGASSEVIRVSGRPPSGPPLHLDTAAVRTQPGAGNDVLRALQSLPGVARTPFGLGGLALRGTAPRDTKVYLDDIEVPLLYHFGGLASFLPTGAVDEVTLEPGGASVRYGRGLGGVAIVTSRTGRGDDWRVGGELSLISAGALAEGPGPRARLADRSNDVPRRDLLRRALTVAWRAGRPERAGPERASRPERASGPSADSGLSTPTARSG